MRQRIVLLVMGIALVAAFALLLYSGFQKPTGAATGQAGGCGGDPLEEPEADAAIAFGSGDSLEAEAASPSTLEYLGPQTDTACPRMKLNLLDRVATLEDPCATPGKVRVWSMNDAQIADVKSAYAEIVSHETTQEICQTRGCINALTQAETQLILEVASPMDAKIDELLDQGFSVPPVDVPEQEEPDSPGTELPAPTTLPAQQVSLAAEEGADFAAGAKVKPGHPLKTDLICYAGKGALDCQAGAGPTISKQKHLKLFRTPGKTVKLFGSLDEVPIEVPGDLDRDMLANATVGMGFVLENNLSTTYTRAWVKTATASSITIEYQIFSAD